MDPEGRNARAIQALLFDHPWAILPEKFGAIAAAAEARLAGEVLSDDLRDRFLAANAAREAEYAALRDSIRSAAIAAGGSRGATVAVIPVVGTITQRAGLMSEMSGGVSTDALGRTLSAAYRDPDIGAVVLDIDSPGGSVYGVQELGDQIRAMVKDGGKPIYAIANSLAASAAYWIGSQATELSVTPGGEVGSIGVFSAHDDLSAMAERVGQRRTYIYAGRHKVDGNPFAPLSDEARDYEQKRVNDYYDAFTGAVARGRGVSVATVRNDYGEGRVLGAADALSAGMVDHIETRDQLISRAMRALSGSSRRASAGQEAPATPAATSKTRAPEDVGAELATALKGALEGGC